MEKKIVNILGTEYTIETHKVSEDDVLKNNQWSGYCGEESKEIVIADMSEKPYFALNESEQKIYEKKTLRHEITHAFLNESGLRQCSHGMECGWSKDDEIVDWFAIQSPKIFKVFQELDIL